jgi:hypothetical protein
MSEEWNEYWRRVRQWQSAGDSERLRLIQLADEAFRYRETDPERAFALLTRGRDEATRLDEPWWVLFFEHWRLSALVGDAEDFARALPLAMELMVRISAPACRNHQSRVSILTAVLTTYIGIDPVGFKDEIERGLAHLEGIIPSGPVSERHVLHFRRTEYLAATERWDEAHDLALRALALADQLREPHNRVWWRAWFLFLLCEVCDALGKTDLLADHGGTLVELSRQTVHLRRTEAVGLCWQAVAERWAGKEQRATRLIHQALALLPDLDTGNIICAGPMARYHELANDLRAAVGVRERALADLERKGHLHRACQMHLERCRLLAQMGECTSADLATARQIAARLRVPQWFLDKLDRLGQPSVDAPGRRESD